MRPFGPFYPARVAVLKEYNVSRHYVTKHEEKYKNLSDLERAKASEALLAKLHTQQTLFTKLNAPRAAAVKTSFLISHKIARNSKPFADGEFVKECMVDSAALICPEKKGAFENIPLSRRTVTRRVEDIAGNLELQLKNRADDFDYFSLALDESCDVRDTAQLLVFLRGITADFTITEELAAMQSMKGTTTGSDLLNEVNACVDKLGLKWDKLAGVTTDGWLSLGKVLKCFWDLREEIREFCMKKGNPIPQLSDADWLSDLGFAVDVTAQMNELNVKLQSKGLFVYEMYSAVKAFMRKLEFLSSQMRENILTHMPTLKEVNPSAEHLKSVNDAPSDVQMELIDLQSDTLLAEKFRSVPLNEFYSSLKEENFPHMRRHAQKILVLFGSTYVCEQTFSVMKFNKSRYRSSMTDDHLSAVLRIVTSDIEPDFNALVQAQERLGFSH
ncbi:hypothetical protein WMY93_013933 [Mugilogobius chulae]|uniref:HAT C-terminal dimerisation domain-containing protein n=1 Tax=Mugilogobius chulae TaxID=88201 RepID=A0AAW0P5F9_9GOBI